MAKSSPEKLAAALRANLKRRKEAKAVLATKNAQEPAAKAGKKAPKN